MSVAGSEAQFHPAHEGRAATNPPPMPGLHLAVGLAQGAALWLIHRMQSRMSADWSAACLYLALALPLAWYLSHGGSQRQRDRTVLLAAIAALFTWLGWHAGRESLGHGVVGAGQFFAAGVLGFVLVPLACGFDAARRRFDYPRLFELAWRNATLVLASFALTGVLWVLLWAGAWLMRSIGLHGLGELLVEPAFAYVTTGGAFGLATALTLRRADTLLALRRFWLSLTTWCLPLALGFALAWVCALPFTGVTPLFDTKSAAFYLFWFGALTVSFANAAFQDGREALPYHPWLARALSWAWLAMLPLAGLADWALAQRVMQHGWTPDRIWGALVGLIVTIHSLGYAAALWRRGAWMNTIPATNIAAALLMVGALTALLSPLGDVRRIAVASQVGRLLGGAIGPEAFDWQFLRAQGAAGQAALAQLASTTAPDATARRIAQRAAQALRDEANPNTQDPQAALATAREHMSVLPRGAEPPASLLEWLSREHADWIERSCLSTPARCRLWLTDLDRDGRTEAVLLWDTGGGVQAVLYALEAAGWRQQGSLRGGPVQLEDWEQAIDSGHVEPASTKWPDLMIDGRRTSLAP